MENVEKPFVRNYEFEKRIQERFRAFVTEVRKVMVGDDLLIEYAFIAFLAESSIILESAPGEGKSLLGRTIARALSLKSQWYQFKADTTPQELLGYVDFLNRDAAGNPRIKFGPLFTNLLIADELNRAPSKVKSPLLSAMEEKLATVPGDYEVRKLPRPFLLIATQNPIEGTGDVYNLGQAELNRFDMQIELPIQTVENLEKIIPRNPTRNLERVEAVLGEAELLTMIDYVSDMASRSDVTGRSLTQHPVNKYIARLASASHFVVDENGTHEGASTRAAVRLWKVLNAYAVLNGRKFLTPRDVQRMVPVVWKHRIIAKDKEEAKNILEETLKNVSPLPDPSEEERK